MGFALGLMGAVWLTSIGLLLWGTWLTLRHFEQPPPHLDAPFGLYPVSILKPLKGADSGLRENLEGFFRLDYPEYELLFSVADALDPAAEVVQSLIRQYRGVRARLIVGQVDVGVNPKVNNMVRSYEQALHDWILISDSNVRVKSDYLKRLVAHLDPSVGVLTAIVAGRNPRGLGGKLEACYLNTFYARGMIQAAAAGQPCVIGKSMLFRRSVAKRFGGIRTLAGYLAEDYMAGEAMRRLGLRVVIMHDPITQHIGNYSFEDFWSRHVRWGRIRKSQAPATFLAEPWVSTFVSGILGSIAADARFGISAPLFFGCHLLLAWVCDWAVMRSMRIRWSPTLPWVWLLREALHFPLWIHVASGNTVKWRGRDLVLRPGGLLDNTT